MKVKELLDDLEKLDPELDVYVVIACKSDEDEEPDEVVGEVESTALEENAETGESILTLLAFDVDDDDDEDADEGENGGEDDGGDVVE